METFLATGIQVAYYAAMLFILVYSVFQCTLAIRYLRSKRHRQSAPEVPGEWPQVTIQLPVYNELYVISRLMDAIGTLEYPRSKLQVQLIDDSTDESAEMGRQKVAELTAQGVCAVQIRRPERTGFKAGALQHALQSATGEFIAIFDADFLPRPDFLKKTIPHFTNKNIGMVQARWGHLNRNHSLLTRLQAMALDLHFTVEQQARHISGCFMNFNGTAGVWRKSAIEDAGGWRDTTLTEDLDLSYRAQLRGWRFKYLEDVEAPAELPVEMNALKSQQYRWNKGGAETARIMLPHIARSNFPLKVKLHAAAHLLNSSVYFFALVTALLSVPFLWAQAQLPAASLSAGYGFLVALLLLSFAYGTSFIGRRPVRDWVLEYPAFLSLSMGLSIHNALAVVTGFMGKRSPFIRTPKFAVIGNRKWRENRYLKRGIRPLTWLEGIMALYLASGVAIGLHMNFHGLIPFHIMGALGFALIFYYSLRHSLVAARS